MNVSNDGTIDENWQMKIFNFLWTIIDQKSNSSSNMFKYLYNIGKSSVKYTQIDPALCLQLYMHLLT